MKCKFCGEEMKKGAFAWICSKKDHLERFFDSRENEEKRVLELQDEYIDNLIKMRAEHAEQKERIEELEKALLQIASGRISYKGFALKMVNYTRMEQIIKDLTPPIKAGDRFWSWTALSHKPQEYIAEGAYKDKHGKWKVVDNLFTDFETYGETAFATEAEARAEAERLNNKGERRQ